MGSHALGRALTGPEVHLSGKHDGLVRYLSRLLRPLWNEPVAVGYKPPGDMQNEQVPTTLFVSCLVKSEKKKDVQMIIRKKNKTGGGTRI